MRKTKVIDGGKKFTVDINGLQAMLSMGKSSADKIGEMAGAVIRVGRRKFYNVQKVEDFLNSVSE